MDEHVPQNQETINLQDDNNRQFSAEQQPGPPNETPHATSPSVSWTASEFVAHQKGAEWYVLLGLGVAAAAVLVFFLTQKDVVSTVVVVIAGIAFGAFGARKPRVLDYAIDETGIHIHEKSYPFSRFRSFSLEDDGVINSILLIPVKRLAPGISVYYPPEQEQAILDTLGNYLPHEERPPDRVEKLMRKVRF